VPIQVPPAESLNCPILPVAHPDLSVARSIVSGQKPVKR
jgi:hypothetical protein